MPFWLDFLLTFGTPVAMGFLWCLVAVAYEMTGTGLPTRWGKRFSGSVWLRFM